MTSLRTLEQEIAKMRKELGNLSGERSLSENSGNKINTWNARVKLGEKALKNCSVIAGYIRKVSESTANELDERNKMAAQALRNIKDTRDPVVLQSWYIKELAPLWNKVEQEWQIIDKMRRKESPN